MINFPEIFKEITPEAMTWLCEQSERIQQVYSINLCGKCHKQLLVSELETAIIEKMPPLCEPHLVEIKRQLPEMAEKWAKLNL